MSSSPDSSDSEERNEQFKGACDPMFALGLLYGRDENTKISSPIHNGLENGTLSEESGNDNIRSSFVLLKKLQSLLSSNGGHMRHRSPLQTESPGLYKSLRKNKQLSQEENTSSFSPYVGKKLLKLLDKKVKLQEQDDDDEALSASAVKTQDGVFLFKNVLLQSLINKAANGSATLKRKVDTFDKKEVALRCKSVALSPEYILDKKGAFPPEPKNLRYLERYVVKKKADGKIRIIPYSDASSLTKSSHATKASKNGASMKMSGQSKMTSEKMLMKRLPDKDLVSPVEDLELVWKKVNPNHGVNLNNKPPVEKAGKRKQSRKRAGKNKRKKNVELT